MAINVTYQVPASLLQQQRQAENRAYKRQVNLMTMQQNFQREQTETNRQFQRETMQTAYDRQRERTADERTYQQELLAHKEGREDALRKQAMELAERQRQEAQIQQAETAAWQDSERQRQALEKQYNYSDTQIAELKQLAADARDAYQQYSQGLITPEQYRSALRQLRARRMGIMPDTPKRPEETMSVEERLKASTWTDPKGNCWYFDKNGDPKIAMPPHGTVSEKLATAKLNALMDAAKSCIAKETGVINKETFKFLKDVINASLATDDGGSAQPKMRVPKTVQEIIDESKNGGSPLQQIMNQNGGGQQQPMPMEQQEQVAAQVEEEAQANRLDELKAEYESLEKKANLNPWHASTSYYRRRQEQVKKQIEEEEAKQAKQAKTVEQPKPKEQPKQDEPKKTTSITFNGISDINGKKAWVNGKRLSVGDKLPNGGLITELDFDNGTLTYELDGETHTIRKSRNAQNI